MTLDKLTTPCLILDRAVLQRNIVAMQGRMQKLGVSLRPHLKTAKSARVAELVTQGQSGGVTVSTLAEAEYFFAHGFRDILYAVGILPSKLDRVAALTDQGADIKIITDNLEAARSVVERAESGDRPFKVLIEIDSGEGRAGITPDDPYLIEIAGILADSKRVELAGVLTHAGHSYACSDIDQVRAVAREERAAVVRAAEMLRTAGHECLIVSAGSTPTAVHADDGKGLTEMRPGVFVFNDLKQLSVGSCERRDLALSVLASVIGQNRRKGHLILDAGALALSKDISAHDAQPSIGYGEVCDETSLAPFPDLFVNAVSQEHGIVPISDTALFDELPIGARVRVLPNHACITAAAHDRYQVLDNGTIVEEWDRVNGW